MLGILVWVATASIVEDYETFGKSSVDLTQRAVSILGIQWLAENEQFETGPVWAPSVDASAPLTSNLNRIRGLIRFE